LPVATSGTDRVAGETRRVARTSGCPQTAPGCSTVSTRRYENAPRCFSPRGARTLSIQILSDIGPPRFDVGRSVVGRNRVAVQGIREMMWKTRRLLLPLAVAVAAVTGGVYLYLRPTPRSGFTIQNGPLQSPAPMM